MCKRQCFGSGSAFDGRMDPDLHSECGSGYKKSKKFSFLTYRYGYYLGPDPHSPKKLDPGPHKGNADLKHCFADLSFGLCYRIV
jgi:hypothetical protein